MSVAVLVAKYIFGEYCNKDQSQVRTFMEFILDSMKQVVGIGWIYVANLFCAIFFMNRNDLDQCTAYWLSIMIDTTLGVFIEYVLLTLIGAIIIQLGACGLVKHPDHFDRGHYRIGSTIDWSRFVKQLAVWLVCVTLMKVVVVYIITHVSAVGVFAMKALGPWDGAPFNKLVLVMILTPCVMSCFQFFVTDTFLKKKGRNEKNRGLSQEEIIAKVYEEPLVPEVSKVSFGTNVRCKEAPYIPYRGPRPENK